MNETANDTSSVSIKGPSEVKQILFGKTAEVKLADGNSYTLREPSLESLEGGDIPIDQLGNLKNMKKLAYIMLREDHPDITPEKAGRLITLSMLNDGSDFTKSMFGVLGLNAERGPNAPAR